VPLSEEEQRLLEQMERALADEDPKFASALRGISLRAHNRRRAVLGTLGFFVGVAVLMTGAVRASTALGVLGFVVMLGSAYVALSFWRRVSAPDDAGAAGIRSDPRLRPGKGPATRRSPGRPSGSTKRDSSGFMDRLEQRWRRRRESGY
jgi:DUF3040 family protein